MKSNFAKWCIVGVLILAFIAPAIFVGANTTPELPERPIFFIDQMVGKITMVHEGKYQEEVVEMVFAKNYPDLYFNEGVTYFHVGINPDMVWGIESNGSSYYIESLDGGWYRIDVTKLAEYPSIFFVELSYK